MKLLCLGALCAALLNGAVLVDRIAAIVGNHVVKASDIDRDLRITGFINGQPVDFSPAARKAAAARLIDQQIIRQELSTQGYGRASDADANALQSQMIRDRFHGSAAQFHAALQRDRVTEQELHEHLLWQLTVLRFIDERFRAGALVTDPEIETYYQQHLAEIRRESPKDFSLAAVSEKIRKTLEGQRVDQAFEEWLAEARKNNRIEYREAAFQ